MEPLCWSDKNCRWWKCTFPSMVDRVRRPSFRSAKGNADQENMMGTGKEILALESNLTLQKMIECSGGV